jgi:hypothetical protein
MECQVEKNKHSNSIETPKLQRPPRTFVPSTEKTVLLKEQPKTGLSASRRAILTW